MDLRDRGDVLPLSYSSLARHKPALPLAGHIDVESRSFAVIPIVFQTIAVLYILQLNQHG